MEKRGKETLICKRNIDRLPSTGDLAHNPGMCPDQELNRRPFCLQGGTQSTELQQSGLNHFLKSDVYRTPPPGECTFVSSAPGMFIKVEYMLGGKTSLHKPKSLRSHRMYSVHDGSQLEISKKKCV